MIAKFMVLELLPDVLAGLLLVPLVQPVKAMATAGTTIAAVTNQRRLLSFIADFPFRRGQPEDRPEIPIVFDIRGGLPTEPSSLYL